MPQNTGGMDKRLYMRLGRKQDAIVDRLKEIEGFPSRADLVRDCLKARCEELGIDWPDENQPADGTERLIEARRKGGKRTES